MTERQAIERMRSLHARGRAKTYAEAETLHRDADEIVLDFLRSHGISALADAWEEVREQWHPYG